MYNKVSPHNAFSLLISLPPFSLAGLHMSRQLPFVVIRTIYLYEEAYNSPIIKVGSRKAPIYIKRAQSTINSEPL